MQDDYTIEYGNSNVSRGVKPLFWQALKIHARLEALGGLERQSPEIMEQEFGGSIDKYWEAVTSPAGLIEQFYREHRPVFLAWARRTAASAETAKEATVARLESVRRGMRYGNLQALFAWELGACYELWDASQRAAAVYLPLPLGMVASEARAKEYKSVPRRSPSASSSGGGGDSGDDSGGSDQPEPPAVALCFKTHPHSSSPSPVAQFHSAGTGPRFERRWL